MKKHSILLVFIVALFAFNALTISKVENPRILEQVYAEDDPFVWCWKLRNGGDLSGYDYKWLSAEWIVTCEWKTDQRIRVADWQEKCYIFAPPPAPQNN